MTHLPNSDFQSLRIAVLTVSDTRNLTTDISGQVLIEVLESTGFTEHDNMPQTVEPLLDIGSSTIQSRAPSGISNGTLVCCLPGSPSACRAAWNSILLAQLDNRTTPCNFVPHLKLPERAAVLCGARS